MGCFAHFVHRGRGRIPPSPQKGLCPQLGDSCGGLGSAALSVPPPWGQLQVPAEDPHSLRWVALEEQHVASLLFLCSAPGDTSRASPRQPGLLKHSCRSRAEHSSSSEHTVTAGTKGSWQHTNEDLTFSVDLPARLGPNCCLAPCVAVPQSHPPHSRVWLLHLSLLNQLQGARTNPEHTLQPLCQCPATLEPPRNAGEHHPGG